MADLTWDNPSHKNWPNPGQKFLTLTHHYSLKIPAKYHQVHFQLAWQIPAKYHQVHFNSFETFYILQNSQISFQDQGKHLN